MFSFVICLHLVQIVNGTCAFGIKIIIYLTTHLFLYPYTHQIQKKIAFCAQDFGHAFFLVKWFWIC